MKNKTILAFSLWTSALLLNTSCKKEKAIQEEQANPCMQTEKVGIFSGNGQHYQYFGPNGKNIDIGLQGSLTITYACYPGFKIELWGTNEKKEIFYQHENLNNKHIKDRLEANRTIVFPDNSKITIVTDGAGLVARMLYIQEKDRLFKINLSNFELETLEGSAKVKGIDDTIADGETSTFKITEEGLSFYTIYVENILGKKESAIYDLGKLIKKDPKVVNDLYDDPRLSNT